MTPQNRITPTTSADRGAAAPLASPYLPYVLTIDCVGCYSEFDSTDYVNRSPKFIRGWSINPRCPYGVLMTTDTVQHAAPRTAADANPQRPINRREGKGLRDPIVAQAIENVTGRHQTDDFWATSPHQRTKAIYDEIKRLDRAQVTDRIAPAKSNRSDLQMASIRHSERTGMSSKRG